MIIGCIVPNRSLATGHWMSLIQTTRSGFIDEPKYCHEEEESEEEIVGKEVEETESDTEDEHSHNIEDESDYDGDDENEQIRTLKFVFRFFINI